MTSTTDPVQRSATAPADLIWRRHPRDHGSALVSRAAPRARTWTAGDPVAAITLFAVAVAIDLFRLAQASIWGDEGFSIGLVSGTWSDLWHFAWTKDNGVPCVRLI